MDLLTLLKKMVDENASDLFLSAGAAPNLKIDGVTRPVADQPLSGQDVKALAYSVMNERQISQFESTLEGNLAIALGDLGRFRLNVYMQRGETAAVVRYIKSRIPSFEELGLPSVLRALVMQKRGLVLIVGAAGSGKSTTLAAMIDYRNTNATGHILTIEDPIEFVHAHRKSVVDQREVGIDTFSFGDALHNALREAPDVIMIGEIRDRETMQHAIAYSETGHLCISTLHANNANQAIDRIINFFPQEAHHQLLMDLSLNLRGIFSQRLIPGTNGKLALALEVMLMSPYVGDLVQKGHVDEIKAVMAKSNEIGMRTFDQSLFELYQTGRITLDEALRNADSRTDLALRVRLSVEHSATEAPEMEMSAADPSAHPHRK